MRFVILLLVRLVTFVPVDLMQNFVGLLKFRLIPLVSLGTLLVIFVLFVLANLMLRPELFPVMTLSDLLRMVLTFLNQKRSKMIEKIVYLFKGLLSHFFRGCSNCASFFQHLLQTVVQILKGGYSNKKS